VTKAIVFRGTKETRERKAIFGYALGSLVVLKKRKVLPAKYKRGGTGKIGPRNGRFARISLLLATSLGLPLSGAV